MSFDSLTSVGKATNSAYRSCIVDPIVGKASATNSVYCSCIVDPVCNVATADPPISVTDTSGKCEVNFER